MPVTSRIKLPRTGAQLEAHCLEFSVTHLNHKTNMVLGLLIFAGIPTTIAVAEGIAEQKKPEEEEDDPKRMAKFHLNVYCDAKSRSTKLINGKRCVLRDNKVSCSFSCVSLQYVSGHA
jgi:hypothetical protein